jgi:hypothetical protein
MGGLGVMLLIVATIWCCYKLGNKKQSKPEEFSQFDDEKRPAAVKVEVELEIPPVEPLSPSSTNFSPSRKTTLKNLLVGDRSRSFVPGLRRTETTVQSR